MSRLAVLFAAALLPLATLASSNNLVPRYLDRQELALLNELNLLRADPAAYAEKLAAWLPYFEDQFLVLPGRVALSTEEGPAAVEEAIAALRKARPLPEFAPSRALSYAAADHARDIGSKGIVAHEGSDGSQPRRRIRRYALPTGTTGEVISFGPSRPDFVVMTLLVDDGVRDRGHRKLLLDGRFRLAGVSCEPHTVYGTTCVIDVADMLSE